MTTTTTGTTETHEEETNQPIMAKSAERLPGTSTRLRTRDDGCCSVNFLKYVLHIYNVVLFVSNVKSCALIYLWYILCVISSEIQNGQCIVSDRRSKPFTFSPSSAGVYNRPRPLQRCRFWPRKRPLLIVMASTTRQHRWNQPQLDPRLDQRTVSRFSVFQKNSQNVPSVRTPSWHSDWSGRK